MRKDNYNKIIIIAILSLIFGNLFFLLNFICNKNIDDFFSIYFIPGTLDDFFTPMMKSIKNTYTEPFFSDYPPLANLIYMFFKMFFSNYELENAATFDTRLAGARYLMTTEVGRLLPLFFFSISFVIMYFLLNTVFNKEESILYKILIVCLIFSGPYLFLMQRGNYLILAVICVTIFLSYYNSNNPIEKEISIIALAIATALKVYPVFFGILLFKKKNTKLIIRAIIYGAIILFIPFFIYDGFSSISHWVHNLFMRNTYKEASIYSYNYNISFHTMLKIFYNIFGLNISNINYKICVTIVSCVCAIIYLCNNDDIHKIIAICLFTIWAQNGSYKYGLCILIYPLLKLLTKEVKNIYEQIYIVCILFSYIPYALPHKSEFIQYNSLSH